jgi:hypothetical protein
MHCIRIFVHSTEPSSVRGSVLQSWNVGGYACIEAEMILRE